ncbi:hypothetical protein C7M84_011727 [Penaeus vannamei]|uniref:C2H2-type domain-containing protein n=1 Tax=Penaeus vannamei TaxID=6689 RepID=A0A3R7QK36_PENVA|nr:hypothetical protein C7M84_011727 [Penaeus vannamei]
MSHLHHHARQLHPDFTEYPCQYCGAVTPTVDALHSHIKVHHGDRLGLPADFTCEVCKESFHTGKALATHRSSRHPGTAECGFCGAHVGSRYLKKHINAVHTKEKTHRCHECGQDFYSRTSLTGHHKRHHAPRKHLCEQCGKGYVNNVELQRHLKAHRNQRDFKSHTGERPHQCMLCQESFIRPLGLRKHMLKHTAARKGKRLKYSKKKIDELTSSVICHDASPQEAEAHTPADVGGLGAGEVAPGSDQPPQHAPPSDLPQTLQVFPSPSSLAASSLAQPQPRLQTTLQQLTPSTLQVQQLAVTDLDGSQLEGQLELSQVVEDLSSGELLGMGPDLLLEATDVRGDDDVEGAMGEGGHGKRAAGEQAAQPVQVIYVQFVEDATGWRPGSSCNHSLSVKAQREEEEVAPSKLDTNHLDGADAGPGEPSNSVRRSGRQRRPNIPPEELAAKLNFEELVCGCGETLASRTDYVDHVLTHVAGAFRCPQCPCVYTCSSRLARHQRLLHSRGDTPSDALPHGSPAAAPADGVEERCHLCADAVSGGDGDLRNHMRVHLCGEHECPVCALRLDTSYAMEMHVQRKHPSLLHAFLKSEDSLKDESSKSEDSGGLPVRCDVCGKVVATPSRLARHRYLQHPEHYPWPCAACTLAFPSLHARDHHVCPHRRKGGKDASGDGKKNECLVCNTAFKSRVSLECHMRRAHPTEAAGPHACPVCGRSLSSRKALTDHLRCHRREGFACEFCGARLKTLDSLNCRLCSQVFFSSGRLSYHMKRHHTDRRSYTNLCHLCGKAYPYPSELRLAPACTPQRTPYSPPSTVAPPSVSAYLPAGVPVSAPAAVSLQHHRPPTAVTVMGVAGGVGREGGEATLVPVVEGQLVEAVVEGQMTEMQPVQYVQVDGLSAGQTVQTVQAVQAVPHMVEGMEYDEAGSVPYQIVHLQILQ